MVGKINFCYWKKLSVLLSFMLFILSFSLFAQTFDWENTTPAPPVGDGETKTITQTVSGITVTVQADAGTDYLQVFDASAYSGTLGTSGYILLSSGSASYTFTFTFSEAVDIQSIYAVEAGGSVGSTWTYTPTGGSNSTVNDAISKFTGQTVTLNWTGVTSFEVTKPSDGSTFAFDDLILGTSASAPTAQASNVGFSGTSTSSTTVSWTRGDGANCAVFMAAASSGTASPVDNNMYAADTVFSSGSQIGSTGWYCIYNGSGTSVSVLGLSSETTYRVHVCEYNGGAGSAVYLNGSETDNPGNVTTSTLPAGAGQITGITYPAYANGLYNKDWLINGKQSWINSNGYYVYWTDADAPTYYWCIDIDTDPSNNTEFYIESSSDVPPERGYTNGTGTGNPVLSSFTLSSAPTTQATNVGFSNTASTSTDISWTRGDGDSCAIFMKATLSGTASPVDGTTYTASTMFGSGTQIDTSGWYCVYNGSNTDVSVSGLRAGTTYRVHICEYNGSMGSEIYLADSGTNNPKNVTTKTPGLWTGVTNNNWHTSSNWDDGNVPTAIIDVQISDTDNDPIMSANAVCKNLTVENSASLTINSSYILNISGDMVLDDGSSFTNNGTLQFSGDDCHLSDNRTTKSSLGNIIIEE